MSWDFKIQTDWPKKYNTSDIIDIKNNYLLFIDVAISKDSNAKDKELENIIKGRFEIEITTSWKKPTVVPIIICTGCKTTRLRKTLDHLNLEQIITGQL